MSINEDYFHHLKRLEEKNKQQDKDFIQKWLDESKEQRTVEETARQIAREEAERVARQEARREAERAIRQRKRNIQVQIDRHSIAQVRDELESIFK